MLKLNDAQLEGLNRLSVVVDDKIRGFLSIKDCLSDEGNSVLVQIIQATTNAPTKAVATSVYMRRHGFLIAAQLHLLCMHNLLWAGSLSDIQLIQDEDLIKFSISSKYFRHAPINQRREDMQYLLDTYGHPIVEYMSKQNKISKLILWENIWGYVLWMYSQLLTEETTKIQAHDDLSILLHDDLWKPSMRRSPFKQYLRNKPAVEAMNEYERVTCCLYKEIPNTDKCPYCPLVKKNTGRE